MELPEHLEEELIVQVVMLLTEQAGKPMTREDVKAARIRSEINKMGWPETIDY